MIDWYMVVDRTSGMANFIQFSRRGRWFTGVLLENGEVAIAIVNSYIYIYIEKCVPLSIVPVLHPNGYGLGHLNFPICLTPSDWTCLNHAQLWPRNPNDTQLSDQASSSFLKHSGGVKFWVPSHSEPPGTLVPSGVNELQQPQKK